MFLMTLLSCTGPSDLKSKPASTDLTKVESTQKNDTIENAFYKSLLDSFSFTKYKVAKIYSGKIAKIDLTYYKDNPLDIRENILYQYANEKQPNFAGHYIIVSWGCGSPCQMNAIIDVRTGKTMASMNTSLGLDYTADSYLLIKNPPTDDKYDENYRTLIGKPEIVIFKDNKLTEIK